MGAPDPEDVAQEAVIVWLAHRTEVEHWRSWIRQVVKNRLIDEHRRRKAHGLQPLHSTWLDGEEDIDLPDALIEPSPSGGAMYRFAVEAAMAAMSPRERRVFELRFRDGWSGADVAVEMGLNRGNVNVIVTRTRCRLRGEFPELFT